MTNSTDTNSYIEAANPGTFLPLTVNQLLEPDIVSDIQLTSFLISYAFNAGEPAPTGETVFIEGIHGELIELFVDEGKIFTKIHKLAKVSAPVLMDSCGPGGKMKTSFTNAIAGQDGTARGVRASSPWPTGGETGYRGNFWGKDRKSVDTPVVE